MTRRMKSTDENEEEKGDWVFAAYAIDRLCIFMLSGLIGSKLTGLD